MIFIEQPGCHWCAKVRRDILPVWANTAEGKRAPMRSVDITQGWPDDLAEIPRERLTPTFILVEDGQELARLRGYPGDHFIWPMLGQMIDAHAPPLQPEEGRGIPRQ